MKENKTRKQSYLQHEMSLLEKQLEEIGVFKSKDDKSLQELSQRSKSNTKSIRLNSSPIQPPQDAYINDQS